MSKDDSGLDKIASQVLSKSGLQVWRSRNKEILQLKLPEYQRENLL